LNRWRIVGIIIGKKPERKEKVGKGERKGKKIRKKK
jgi:hypothetical protein